MAKIYRPPQLEENRFFCDHCNHEVSFNAEVCPNCGKQFDSVQCPVCRYTDKPMYFMSGCPKCGYLSPRTQLGRKGLDGDTTRHKPRKKRKQQDVFLPLLTILSLALLAFLIWQNLNQ
jgi:ssDNA-binding Zn-finger/Zn-ribbon topoisomerase 1